MDKDIVIGGPEKNSATSSLFQEEANAEFTYYFEGGDSHLRS